jgi:hypothetical protein
MSINLSRRIDGRLSESPVHGILAARPTSGLMPGQAADMDV